MRGEMPPDRQRCGTRNARLGQNSLLSDGRLLNQLLAEDYALVAPLETFLHNGPGVADDGAGHHEALVVEI